MKPKLNNPTLQTNVVRDKAEVLIERLIRLREEAARTAQRDTTISIEKVNATQHAIEKAIISTRRVIDQLNRTMEELGS
jgi:hypothetical protein